MEFIIHPYEGVEIPSKGLIRFGMARDEVRSFFDEAPKEFFKSVKDKVSTDAFDQSDLHCFYNSHYAIEAFEFGFNALLFLNSVNLFSFERIEELKNFLNKGLNADLIATNTGYNSETLGISIYSPDPNQDQVEGIFVFRALKDSST
jgi:hypothetical protein